MFAPPTGLHVVAGGAFSMAHRRLQRSAASLNDICHLRETGFSRELRPLQYPGELSMQSRTCAVSAYCMGIVSDAILCSAALFTYPCCHQLTVPSAHFAADPRLLFILPAESCSRSSSSSPLPSHSPHHPRRHPRRFPRRCRLRRLRSCGSHAAAPALGDSVRRSVAVLTSTSVASGVAAVAAVLHACASANSLLLGCWYATSLALALPSPLSPSSVLFLFLSLSPTPASLDLCGAASLSAAV